MDLAPECLQVGLDGAVGDHRDDPAALGADGPGDGLEGGVVAADHGHGDAVAAQGLGGGGPDSPGAPGDHGDLTGQVR